MSFELDELYRDIILDHYKHPHHRGVAARRVAEHIGSDHHELVFSAQDVADNLPHVIYHLESADADLVRALAVIVF